jgi:uncharacterized protein YihD (DUF1040 family)
MRNPERIDEILNRIKEVWKLYPDMRLGQLILNVINDPALYYIEDSELADLLEKYYGGLK